MELYIHAPYVFRMVPRKKFRFCVGKGKKSANDTKIKARNSENQGQKLRNT
jgi:hypothetical protein